MNKQFCVLQFGNDQTYIRGFRKIIIDEHAPWKPSILLVSWPDHWSDHKANHIYVSWGISAAEGSLWRYQKAFRDWWGLGLVSKFWTVLKIHSIKLAARTIHHLKWPYHALPCFTYTLVMFSSRLGTLRPGQLTACSTSPGPWAFPPLGTVGPPIVAPPTGVPLCSLAVFLLNMIISYHDHYQQIVGQGPIVLIDQPRFNY